MNKKQKTVLAFTALAIALLQIFPPLKFSSGGLKINYGYNFILNPPDEMAFLNTETMFVQLISVVILGYIGIQFFKE